MKKLFILFLLALTNAGANAQISTTPIRVDGGLRGINKKFLYDPETPYIVSGNWYDSAGEILILDKELNTVKSIPFTEKPISLHIYEMEENLSDYYMTLTQTLFNKDEKFEYIVGIPTENNDRYSVQGIKVVSEDGTVLQTIMYPNKESIDEGLKIVVIGDCCYLRFSETEVIDGEYIDYYLLYKINQGADPSKVSISTEPVKVRAFPGVTSRHQDITVTCEGEGTREIIIRNSAGQVVYSTKIADGEQSVRINACNLSTGLNIVSVVGNHGKEESCKVIVNN